MNILYKIVIKFIYKESKTKKTDRHIEMQFFDLFEKNRSKKTLVLT